MAFQGERGQGGLDMCVSVKSMAQDKITVQEQSPPQPNSEPEMGAAAEAAVYDTPHPSSVKILPRSPAKPRPIMADRASHS